MQIFIMRHGEANFNSITDAERELTEKGKALTIKVAQWLETHSFTIDKVLVSPYLRAQQTLSVLQDNLSLPSEAETLAELTPNGDERKIIAYLQALSEIDKIDAVFIVSHLPLVGDLVGLLCPQQPQPTFYTSTVAYVDYDPLTQVGDLKWLYHGM